MKKNKFYLLGRIIGQRYGEMRRVMGNDKL